MEASTDLIIVGLAQVDVKSGSPTAISGHYIVVRRASRAGRNETGCQSVDVLRKFIFQYGQADFPKETAGNF